MRKSHSPQHASLLRHAKRGKMVFYVAPEFDRRNELNDFYQKGIIPLRSAFFDPKDIGPIDDASHHVAYRAGLGSAWLCSDPRRLNRHTRAEVFLSDLREAVADAPLIEDSQPFFEQLADEVIETALKTEVEEEESDDTVATTPSFPVLRDPDAERRTARPTQRPPWAGQICGFCLAPLSRL